MKGLLRPILIAGASLLLLAGGGMVARERFVYLSAGGELTVFRLDSESGGLSPIQSVPGSGLIAVTKDQSRAYVISPDTLRSFHIGEDGKLTEFANAAIENGGGYLDLDETERYLASSNYGAGTVTVWPIDEIGAAQGNPAAHLTLEQKAHSSVFAPGNEFLLVPATGPNKVFQLKFDAAAGTLEPNEPAFAPGPDGEGDAREPRHLVFHPNGRTVYTTLERDLPGVGVWAWNAEAGTLEIVQNIPTLPEAFEGYITTADLHLTPDARFLYVSNRDLTDRKATSGESSIVGFSVDPESGRLTMIGHTPCEHIPRSFAIDGGGEYLYVAGQMAEKLGVYRIDAETGALARVQQLETGKSPNWVVCVTKD